MKKVFILMFIISSSFSFVHAAEIDNSNCGTSTVSELVSEGWKIVKEAKIESISLDDRVIILNDGTSYRADMTSGMLAGDHAILLSKYVKSDKAKGYIYNLCAGGFDAWVNPK